MLQRCPLLAVNNVNTFTTHLRPLSSTDNVSSIAVSCWCPACTLTPQRSVAHQA